MKPSSSLAVTEPNKLIRLLELPFDFRCLAEMGIRGQRSLALVSGRFVCLAAWRTDSRLSQFHRVVVRLAI